MPKDKKNKSESRLKMKKNVGVMINYPVGDFLIRLKNASLTRKKSIEVPSTKFVKTIAETLKKEGYLDEVIEKDAKLVVSLSFRKKSPNLTYVKLISTPGLRIYMDAEKIESIKGPSIFLVSTPKGIMTSRQAVKSRLGGEVIAEIL